MSKFLGWLLACACLLVASFGSAASKGIVILAEGSDSEPIRRKLVALVPPGLPVQDAAVFNRAVEMHGIKGSVGDALSNPRTRKRALQSIKAALAKSDVEALLSARTKRVRGGADDVRIVLIVRSQTEPVVEELVTSRDAQGRDPYSALLNGPLQELAAAAGAQPSAPPPAASAQGAPVANSASTTPAAPASDVVEATNPAVEAASGDNAGIDRVRPRVDFRTGMFVLEAGGGFGRRNFKYNDPARGPLRDYVAPGMAMWSAAGQLYPFANTGIAIVKDLGATGNVAGSVPFTSSTSDGSGSADGSWTKYAAGAHLRIRTSSRPNSTLFGIEALYGGSHFAFSGSDAAGRALAAEIPTVNYKYVRGGADVRAPLGSTPISLHAAGGFMRVLSAGAFSDRFPHASINGVDARLGASFAIAPWIEAKASAEYTHVFSSFKPQRGDLGDIAGGALDQFFVFNVGVAAIF